MGTRSTLMVCFLMLTAFPAAAEIDWNDNPADWDAIKAEKGEVSIGEIDFDEDPDYGVTGFSGPLTSAGAGPVSPGVVLDNVVMDTVAGRDYPTNLLAVGPSAGFGNPSNAVVANYFLDSFQIRFRGFMRGHMVMLNFLSLGGPPDPKVDVSFYDWNDQLIGTVGSLDAPATGHPVLRRPAIRCSSGHPHPTA